MDSFYPEEAEVLQGQTGLMFALLEAFPTLGSIPNIRPFPATREQ